MLVADLPKTRGIGIGRNAFKHERRRAIGERTINYISMPCHPADIGGAPINIILFQIEYIFMGHGGPDEITSCRVQNAFWLSC